MMAEAEIDPSTDMLPPATLPGSPAAGSFPIPPEKLIELAKRLFKEDIGLKVLV